MKRAVSFALALALIAPFRTTAAYAGNSGGQAAVSLLNASAGLSQTGNSAGTLVKTGTVDTNASTLTWTITGTEGTTTSGHLVVDGVMTVYNSGPQGATIGNIGVNLQTKSGSNAHYLSEGMTDGHKNRMR